jgi:hypothetical protein
MPAEPRAGQLSEQLLGETLYLPDVADLRYSDLWHYDVTRARVLKLAALFDFHRLPDCATDLLLSCPSLTSESDRTTPLDMLVKSAGFSATFAEETRRFEGRPTSFYPEARKPPPVPPLLRGAVVCGAVPAKAKRLLNV